MNIDVFLQDTLPDRVELDRVLNAYCAGIFSRMSQIGFDIGPEAPEAALNEFWRNAQTYLPPHGALALARREDGRLVGCGMLKRVDAQTGELKRLFVEDSARGTGTGHRLVTARIDAARKMGLRRLIVDTLSPNVEMRSLYAKLGFDEVDEPLETTSYRDLPDLRPHMHFFVKTISS